MNEWPTGWFREDKPAAPQDGNAMPGAAGGSAAAGSAAAGSPAAGSAAAGGASGMPGAANDPTVRMSSGSGAAGSSYGAGSSSYGPGGSGYASPSTDAPASP